jgi:hypothetical protein
MKKSTLTFTIICAVCAMGALSYAGSEKYSGKDKEVMQQAPAPCEWYRAHEWDFDVWGAYGFAQNSGRNDNAGASFDGDIEPPGNRLLAQKDIGEVSNDRFINRDGAWAGGADIKYFVSKYWGFGGTGFVMDTNDNIGGAGLVTFDFRYPIGCSRFAPYGWMGVGAYGGGSHTIRLFNDLHSDSGGEAGEEEEVEFRSNKTLEDKRAGAIGQFGGGLEIRITRHVGAMLDISYNLLSGPDNNFWMPRFGITLSY